MRLSTVFFGATLSALSTYALPLEILVPRAVSLLLIPKKA
jgi:hypothetical protein